MCQVNTISFGHINPQNNPHLSYFGEEVCSSLGKIYFGSLPSMGIYLSLLKLVNNSHYTFWELETKHNTKSYK